MIIGIGGVSRAGKTTLANILKSRLKGKTIAILNQDDFVKKAGLPVIKNHIDWEHPDSLDWTRLKDSILEASKKYDLVIVEGIFAFHSKKITKLYHHKIFVTISKELFFERKRRDHRWGKEPEWFLNHIWHSYSQYGGIPLINEPVLVVDGQSKINIEKFLNYLIR